MYTGLKHLHSFTAYLTLAFIITAVIYAVYFLVSNKSFSKWGHTMRLLALIGAHFQIIFGIFLYFVSPLGLSNFSGENMKNAIYRLYMLEHPLTMLIAVTLITIGYMKSKRAADDKGKLKHMVIFYGLGLVLVLSRIPWEAWLGV
jgi:uncharacterized membrane protein